VDMVLSVTSSAPEYHFGPGPFKYHLSPESRAQEELMSLSGVFRSRLTRRIAEIILVLAGVLALQSCWVESINSLYEGGFARKDPDVVFEQRLTGSWSVTEDKCTIALTISAKENTYGLESIQQGEGCSDAGKKSRQQARLVKLDAHYFFDVSPMDDDVCEMCLAKHTIYQMKIDKDSFSLIPIDSDWLKNAMEKKVVVLATLPDDTDTLTASSADLKTFCRRYADDSQAFKPEGLNFERK